MRRGPITHPAEHRVTFRDDPEAPEGFHGRAMQRVLGIYTGIRLAKTLTDGTYYGRGRARRPLYLEEFMDRFNRRHRGG